MKPFVLVASLAFLGLLGCTDSRTTDQAANDRTTDAPARNTPTVPESTPATPQAGAPASGTAAMSDADRALAQRVEEALRQDTTVASAAQNIQVHAMNGEVTLRGSVSSEQEKTNLASAAEKVPGVTRINNQLEVASASR